MKTDRILIISDDGETIEKMLDIIHRVRPENGVKIVHNGTDAILAISELQDSLNQIIFDCSIKDRMEFISSYKENYNSLLIPFIFICNKCFEKKISVQDKFLCTRLNLNIFDVLAKPIDKKFFKAYKEASKARSGFIYLNKLKTELGEVLLRIGNI